MIKQWNKTTISNLDRHKKLGAGRRVSRPEWLWDSPQGLLLKRIGMIYEK